MSTNPSPMNEITPSVTITSGMQNVRGLSSSDLHAAILAKYVAGMRVATIARELRVTRATVYAHIRKQGAIAAATMSEIEAMVPP